MYEQKPTYLIKVDPTENNNKFYKMTPTGNTFTVEYGRVGTGSFQTTSYPIHMWRKKLSEKLNKGYIDQTRLMSLSTSKEVGNNYAPIENPMIADIVKRLMTMARQAINDNYTISSNKVTQTMIDEAQYLIGRLSTCTDVRNFNSFLLDLFRTIPRKMKNVNDELLYSVFHMDRIIQREQDLLDVMRGQVFQGEVDSENPSEQESVTVLEKMGLRFSEIANDEENIIKKNLGNLSNLYSNAWKVTNLKTQAKFESFVNLEDIKDTRLLWHGSKNENWWSIINMGLVLRPNAPITGKMFGYGIYFAPLAKKSFGYTSYSGSYWAGGRSNIAYMSLFDVAYGNPYNVYSHSQGAGSTNYAVLKSNGAHCLHAHAGQMLYNDEIVVYKEDQTTIKYLVELK